MPRTLFSGADDARSLRGFALIEVVCVLAIVGLMAAVILPAFSKTTTRPRLEAYAIETATLLKADRNMARRRGLKVATEVFAPSRIIRSGVTGRTLNLPSDIVVEAMLAARCNGRTTGTTIDFYPSGMSCGGVIALVGPNMRYEVRVNWLTGGIDVVPQVPL